ncbi:MAG: AraC family transcriptional regulator [Agathobacter sp.]|nr:AraC family transcriptional regulator [Agathobacter sp.]
MIETLNGIFETVNCRQNTSLKLYNNDEAENYPAHWHTSMEIIMPENNIYTVKTKDQTVVLNEYDIAIICPGCIHTLYAPATGKRIIFQPDVSSFRFMSDVDSLITLMSPMIVITPETYPEIHSEIKDLILSIREKYLQLTSYVEVEIYSMVLRILSIIGQNFHQDSVAAFSKDNAKQEEYYDRFIKICDYINEHCAEDLTLEAVADISGFSKFYFSKLFKQFSNVSFYKYVNQKRIAMAEMLLIDPCNSVTDVALSCGFSSLSPFIRMFKLIKGCTPTEFRNMYKCCNNSTYNLTVQKERAL